MKDISQSVRDEIIGLHCHTSKTFREIADDVGVSVNAVGLIIKRYEESGDREPARKGRCGRKPILSEREKIIMARESKKNPQLTSSAVKLEAGSVGEKVSLRTTQRVLSQMGRKAYRPVQVPQLDSAKRAGRLQWARVHASLNMDFWEKVRKTL